MYPEPLKKEMRKLSQDIEKHFAEFVDDFLRWYIIYGDDNSELIKLATGPEKEQQEFLAKCRKEAAAQEVRQTTLQKEKAKEVLPKSKIPSAEAIFDRMFKGWPSSSGKTTVIPYGDYIKKLKEKQKKEAQKRG